MPAPATVNRRGWQNKGLVRHLDERRARWIWITLVGFAVAASPFIAYVIQIMRYVETSYALQELRGRQERLVEAERLLRVERAVLESLPEVETKASRSLGLERPAPGDVIVVRPDELDGPSRASGGTVHPSPVER